MEPLSLALVAASALGAGALPPLLLMQRRAEALLERLVEAGAIRPRSSGRRVGADFITAQGAVRLEVAAGVVLNRWRLTAPLPSLRAEESARLFPTLEPRLFGELGQLDLGPPKSDLPRLSPDADRATLERSLRQALPTLSRGSYPVISRAEAAWLVRLVLHKSADQELAGTVVRKVRGFRVSPAAKRAGFGRLLAFLERGGGADPKSRARTLDGLQLAVEVRFLLSRLRKRAWSLKQVGVSSSTLSVVGNDRGIATREDLWARFEAAAELVRLVDGLFDDGGPRRLPCPSCRVITLDPPAGELAERECPRCGGRLLDKEAVRSVLLEPNDKTPGDVKEAALGARGSGVVCPSCSRTMAPVLVGDDVIVDVCTGCGAAFLDEGELAALSEGRYAG